MSTYWVQDHLAGSGPQVSQGSVHVLRARAASGHWGSGRRTAPHFWLSFSTGTFLLPGDSSSFRTNKWRIILLKNYHGHDLFSVDAIPSGSSQGRARSRSVSAEHRAAASGADTCPWKPCSLSTCEDHSFPRSPLTLGKAPRTVDW